MEREYIVCPKCEKALPIESNYCNMCGEAITDTAIKRDSLRLENAGLLKLNQLAKEIKDPAIIKAIMDFVKKS